MCDFDCFNCKFSDCINDELRADAYKQSDEITVFAKFDRLDNKQSYRKRYKKAYNKAYYKENKKKIQAYKKAYYEENKDKIQAHDKAYREKNKDRIQAYNRVYNKAYYERKKLKISNMAVCTYADVRQSPILMMSLQKTKKDLQETQTGTRFMLTLI